MNKYRYVKQTITVAVAGDTDTLSFDSPSDSERLVGMRAIYSDRDCIVGSTIQMKIGGVLTVMDSDFLIDLLETVKGEIAIKDRWFGPEDGMDYVSDGKRIDIETVDGAASGACTITLQFKFLLKSN